MSAELCDRERVTQYVMRELASTITCCNNRSVYEATCWESSFRTDVHPAKYRVAQSGDLVLAQTARTEHRFMLSWYVRALPEIGGALVREIGSDDVCRYGNESFTPIVGVPDHVLYESHTGQRVFYLRVLAAFRRGGSYYHRFGGLRFDGDEAVIRIRRVYSDELVADVRMPWSKRITIKAILAALVADGYGGDKP